MAKAATACLAEDLEQRIGVALNKLSLRSGMYPLPIKERLMKEPEIWFFAALSFAVLALANGYEILNQNAKI